MHSRDRECLKDCSLGFRINVTCVWKLTSVAVLAGEGFVAVARVVPASPGGDALSVAAPVTCAPWRRQARAATFRQFRRRPLKAATTFVLITPFIGRSTFTPHLLFKGCIRINVKKIGM